MAIIKEYFKSQVEMRGPGAWGAAPATTGVTCVLRSDDNAPLRGKMLAELFSEVGKDFPNVPAAAVAINAAQNRVEVSAQPPAGYRQLPARTIGARG